VKKIFVDTGAWYALKNKNDPEHTTVFSFFEKLPVAGIFCYTSDYVIDESITLVKARLKNHLVATTLAEELFSEKAARLIYVAPRYLPRALEIYKKYNDQQFSFTDCTSFAIMESLNIDEALAFDRHFSFKAFGFRQYKS